MKFSVEKKDLIKNLASLSNIVPSKNTMPILTNYLIETFEERNEIRITATDLEITVVVEFELHVAESGKAAVSARDVTDIVNSLPDAMIYFEKKEDKLHIKCDNANFDLVCAEHEQFPLIPHVDMSNAKEVDAGIFSKMIENTHFAVSSETNRPVFTGIFWKIAFDHQIMVSTDGKKIAEFKVMQPNEIENEIEKIVPTKGLLFIKKVINEEQEKISVLIDENRVMFHYGNYTIFSHVLEGKFPDYTVAMPKDNSNTLTISKDVLKNAVRRSSLLSSEDNHRIKFELSETDFTVKSTNREKGEAVEKITAYNYKGKDLKIAFNYKFLNEILSVIETEKVMLTFGNSQSPILLYNVDLEAVYDARFLLMPLRIG